MDELDDLLTISPTPSILGVLVGQYRRRSSTKKELIPCRVCGPVAEAREGRYDGLKGRADYLDDVWLMDLIPYLMNPMVFMRELSEFRVTGPFKTWSIVAVPRTRRRHAVTVESSWAQLSNSTHLGMYEEVYSAPTNVLPNQARFSPSE
ncbi:hypothetical protein ARMGADRAFT_1172476 [Armillaria gallica]|uniref:Uncharacterized protein n=1 Tax=Armillaria gallica TaxID=47427 RepID=A0A2H3C814_ARMGA|nr:hypothetical protein ARMGADRAFT_1172476 [Armillaria gallica]